MSFQQNIFNSPLREWIPIEAGINYAERKSFFIMIDNTLLTLVIVDE